jgi:hypothetical protein
MKSWDLGIAKRTADDLALVTFRVIGDDHLVAEAYYRKVLIGKRAMSTGTGGL